MSALRHVAPRAAAAAAAVLQCAGLCRVRRPVATTTTTVSCGALLAQQQQRRMTTCQQHPQQQQQQQQQQDDNDGDDDDDDDDDDEGVSEAMRRTGYYRLPDVRQIVLDPSVYEVRLTRGSGPGGQGTNSSSNKVELRVNLARLATTTTTTTPPIDARVLAALRRREAGRAVTADGTTLIVSAHEHRSAHHNREACLSKVRQLLHAASWVPPAAAPPVQRASATITRSKQQRRKKGNQRRMAQTARKVMWRRRCVAVPVVGRVRVATALTLRLCSTSGGADNDNGNNNNNNNNTSDATPAAVRAHVYARDFRAVAAPRGGMSQEKHDTLMNMWRSASSEHSPVVNHATHARAAGANGHTATTTTTEAAAETTTAAAQHDTAPFRDMRPAKPDESDEVKRKRLYYQSQYRGMVEMDLVLGHFARCKLASLDATMLSEYDVLLRQLDNDLYNWLIMGQTPPHDIARLRCLGELRAFVANERHELLGHY